MWIEPARLYDGETLRTGGALRIEDGRVAELGVGDAAQRIEGTITPGFVDLQVNGGGGALLNNDPSVEGLRSIAEAHRHQGTVAIMPTVITDAPGVIEAAAEAVIASDARGVIGLHIEGPHIAMAKRGTHAAEYVRPFEPSTLDVAKRLHASGRVVMVTVAPEIVAPDDIAALVAAGAVVSIGHTNADADTIDVALAAGATCGTHLFNAMSQMTARAPGAVGALLASGTSAGIIADGHHVDMRLVAQTVRSNPDVFLVSDAMATVGGPGRFSLYGQTIRVEGGKLVNAEGNLAGAHTTLAEGVVNLTKTGVEASIALQSVTSAPARAIGRPHLGGLIGRDIRDILVLDAGLNVQHTLADATVA